MRRNAFTLLQMAAVLGFLLVAVAVIFPIFGRSREPGRIQTCLGSVKQISLGMGQYVQDYDEFPLVNSGKQGWMDILQPYLKSTYLFQCPKESSGATAGKSDYFYNARLSGLRKGKLSFITSIVMLGDGLGESPSNASLSQMPSSWKTDSYSPAWRHEDGANYAFADGHVKWLKPENVTNQKPAAGIVTFDV